MKSIKNLSKNNKLSLIKPNRIGLSVFFVFFLIVLYIVSQQYQIAKKAKNDEMYKTLEAIHKNIDQSLKNNYTTALTLALTINDNGIPENFDGIGKQLLASNNSIDAVQLVPDGIIRYTYPLKGNEAAIGLNILTSKKHQFEAFQSIKNKKMYFAGPLELKQGGLGILGRLPVYKNNKFWGFSAVIIRLKTLLRNSGVNTLDSSKYYFQLSKISPITHKEVFFLPVKENSSNNDSVSNIIPDGDWKLYLTDRKPNELYIPLIIKGIIGLFLASLIGFLTTSFFKKPFELQLLIDQQNAKLLNSEIKFKGIFDQASIGIAHLDNDSGKFIEVNEKFCSLLGYSKEEMINLNYQSLKHPEDLENNSLNIQKLNSGEINDYSIEKRYITKSKNTIWVNLTVTAIWEKDQTVKSHIKIIEDISVKKEAEESLQKSKLRFKSLFDYSPVALWEKDYSLVKNYLIDLNLVNKSPEEITLFLKNNPEVLQNCFSLVKIINVNNQCLIQYAPKTKSELIKNTNIIFDEESIPSFTKHIIAICTRKNNLKMDAKIKNPLGEIRDVSLIYSVMEGYEDSLERVIISTEDITERKTAEKIIFNSQQKIESLINTVDGIVWECDAQTLEFTFISKKVEDILGYSSEEWINSPNFWENHIHPEDKDFTLQFCTEQTNQNLNHDFEYRMIAKDGSIVWLRDIVNVIIENGKASSLRGIMIDITKNKEIEKDLNNSFNLVSEQNKRLLNFSYIVSHNLRSHTSNISSIVELIETSDSEEEKEEMIQLLKSVSDSLNETMLNLNEVVNIQTNVGLVTEALNLKQYLENTLNILSDQIEMKGINVISSINNDIEVNYNPAYLESILYNLISNAVRYSHIEKNPTVAIDFYTENNMKVLQVSDNGIGIDLKKNGHKIFGMYKKFSNHKDSKGIGLFITKNQIDAMGGNITVESEPNRGTTFKIYIA